MDRSVSLLFLGISLLLILSACSSEEKQWRQGWRASTPMSVARAGPASVQHDNFIYVIGGVDGRIFLRTVEYTHIKEDGTLAPWQNTSILPEARAFASAVYYQGYLYVVGGANGENGKHLLNSVARAQVLADGDLGPWQPMDSHMLLPRRCSKLFVYGDTLYSIGGFAGALLDNVEKTRFDASGVTGDWQMEPNLLTMPRYIEAVKQKGALAFVLGGHHPRQGSGLSAVEWTRLDKTPLQWQKTEALQRGRYGLAAAIDGETIFAMGGLNGSQFLNDVEYAAFSQDKGVSPWRKTTPLPENLANFATAVYKHRLYIMGGVTSDNYHRQTYVAQIGRKGQLGFWIQSGDKMGDTIIENVAEPAFFLPNSGIVSDFYDTDNYTYIHLSNSSGSQWIAAPKIELKKGQGIRFSRGTVMSNFHSKSLNRTFAEIAFVSQVEVTN